MLRRVSAIAWIEGKNTNIQGFFHGWSQNYEELRGGVGNFPVAIVEVASGGIHLFHAENVQFLDPLPQ
jgi:hypothetical protein